MTASFWGQEREEAFKDIEGTTIKYERETARMAICALCLQVKNTEFLVDAVQIVLMVRERWFR